MKHLLLLVAGWMIFIQCNAQKIDSATLSKLSEPDQQLARDYLNQSKRLKKTANIMLVGGLAGAGLGLTIYAAGWNSVSEGAMAGGAILFGLGLTSTIVSIPVYIISGVKHSKAKQILKEHSVARISPAVYFNRQPQFGIRMLVPVGK